MEGSSGWLLNLTSSIGSSSVTSSDCAWSLMLLSFIQYFLLGLLVVMMRWALSSVCSSALISSCKGFIFYFLQVNTIDGMI